MDSAGVPVPLNYQIVSFYLFDEIWKAWDKPYLPVLNLKVKPKGFTVLKTIYVVDVMLGKLQSELYVKGVYTTDDP